MKKTILCALIGALAIIGLQSCGNAEATSVNPNIRRHGVPEVTFREPGAQERDSLRGATEQFVINLQEAYEPDFYRFNSDFAVVQPSENTIYSIQLSTRDQVLRSDNLQFITVIREKLVKADVEYTLNFNNYGKHDRWTLRWSGGLVMPLYD